MVNRDIVFELGNEYQHEVYNIKDVFYTREYVYNFEFKFHVNNNDVPINNVIIYKNGLVYNECKVYQNGMNDYEVKDDNWIKYGNNNYAVEIVLEGGRIYKNDFYLKVLSGYVEDDMVVESFSTYGLHENYSPLDILLQVDTKYTIDRVLLYYHIAPLTQINSKSWISAESADNEHFDSKEIKWSYLGQMELKNSQYVYTHLLFDTTMREENRTLLYKAVVVTTNELKKVITMSTMIKPNTMSVNTIQYVGTEKNKGYDIYGGVVGRIKCPIGNDGEVLNPQYDGKIFEMMIDKKETTSYLTIVVDKNYRFQSENIHVDYMRRLFNKNQTNKDPNYFEIYGEGFITLTVDEERHIYHKDKCRFVMKLSCGDDIIVSFNITPASDSSLAIRTEKTINNIIKYSSDGEECILDSEAVDKSVTLNSKTGWFRYSKNTSEFRFYDIDRDDEETVLAIGMSIDYFKNSDFRIYNGDNFYFINYDEYGIHIVKYDGINYDKIDYKVTLTEQTLKYIKSHNVCCFDKDDNLYFRFINFDNSNVLEKIIVEKNELTVIDCSDMLTMAYNELRKRIVEYVDNLEYITVSNVNYYISSSSNFDVMQRDFKTMGYDDFNLQLSVQELTYDINMPINVQFKELSSNVKINFTTNMRIKCVSDVLFYDNNYSIGNPRFDFEINCDNLVYSHKDKGKNLIPQIGYEKLNNRFFFKFSKPFTSSSADDYANFKYLTLYRGSSRLYDVQPQDVYGRDTTKTSFLYRDLCHTRIIGVAYNILDILVYQNGKVLITRINTELKEQLYQKIVPTDIVFEEYYSYTDEQLSTFETLLMQSYLYDTTTRTMYIFSITDRDSLSVIGIDNKYRPMEQISSISGTPQIIRKSFMLSYTYAYPLNIKNRSTYLLDLHVKHRE